MKPSYMAAIRRMRSGNRPNMGYMTYNMNSPRDHYDDTYINNNYMGNTYMNRDYRTDRDYRPEDRYRDERGREHYDNGRYAPRNDGYITWGNRREENRNMMGFDTSSVRREMEYPQMNEMSMRGNHDYERGYAKSDVMTRQMAEEWVGKMENADETHGPHWSMEQVKQVMAQHKVECDPIEFFVAINMMYSDYCAVLRKHGIGNKIDIYVDMAKAFLDDKDARPDKLMAYYEYVVK